MAFRPTVPHRPEPPTKPQHAKELRETVGHLCEVRKPNNTLVFLGRVKSYDGASLCILPTGGRGAPPVIYNDEFKIILHVPNRPSLAWMGHITGSSPSFWMLGKLTSCHQSEQRVSFRQPVALRANLLCINALYPNGPRGKDEYFSKVCKVVDVSLGGVQLRGPDFYRPGDHLLLTNLYLDKARPFVFTLHVRWAAQVSPVEAHLGCSFENMTVRDEDRLCAAILELQRQDIARQWDF